MFVSNFFVFKFPELAYNFVEVQDFSVNHYIAGKVLFNQFAVRKLEYFMFFIKKSFIFQPIWKVVS